MCFNKSKASSANTSSTVNRDERIALDGGAQASVIKDITLGANATMNVSDMSPDVLALAEGFLSDAMSFVAGVAQNSVNFARETQAAYADVQADTSAADLKQVIETGIQAAMVIAGLYFAMQVLK